MTARVTVVGLGPGDADLMTAATLRAVEQAEVRIARTLRHPAAAALGDVWSCDDLYESADRIDEVYPAIVERVVGAAIDHGHVLYAVPGAPDVAERTVELLRAESRVALDVLPAMSFLDLTWARLGIDPLAHSVRIVDGYRFAVDAAGERGPLLVCQCDSRAVLSDIKLALEDPPEAPVTLLQRLGLPDEVIRTVPWEDLDRAVEPDHLTTLWIPEVAAPVAGELQRFDDLVRLLRQRCPWDREQTHHSLIRYLVEETYEVIDAIRSEDPDALEEELGDLLFQVVFHATIATQEGWFTLADVARGVHDKLTARHPHVFDPDADPTTEQLGADWEAIKKLEKGRSSVFDGVPTSLPASLYAEQVRRKAARVGLDAAPLDAPELAAADADAALRAAVEAFVARARSAGY